MTQVADEREIHQTNFSRLEEQTGETAPWLDDLRKTAMKRFEAVGFPSTKDEEWRFTNVAPIAKTPFQLADLPREGSKIEAATKTPSLLRSCPLQISSR